MVRTSVLRSVAALAAVVLLSGSATAAERGPASLSLDELIAGDVVEITTTKGRYRFTLLDTATGEARGQAAYGDDPYSTEHRVYVLGSTQGRDAKSAGMMLVRMRRIRVGMRLELGIRSLKESDRRLTARVQSIRVTQALGDRVAVSKAR